MGCCGCLSHPVTRFVLRFIFSDFGLCILVMSYTVGGAWIFIAIEGQGETDRLEDEVYVAEQIQELRNLTAYAIIRNTPYKANDPSWKGDIKKLLDNYQAYVADAIQNHKYPGYVPQSQDLTHGWDPSSAILFTASILTTIGYGQVYPVLDAGKLAVIFYAIFAVPLMTLFLTNVGMGLADVIRWIWTRICCGRCNRTRDLNIVAQERARELEDEANGINFESLPQEAWLPEADATQREIWATEKALQELEDEEADEADVPILLSLGFVALYILGGTLLFWYWQEWSMVQSGYFCMISLLTIGFGDFVPGFGDNSVSGRLQMAFSSVYIILGLSILAMGMNLMTHTIKHHFKQMAVRVKERAAAQLASKEQQQAAIMSTDPNIYDENHKAELNDLTAFPPAKPYGYQSASPVLEGDDVQLQEVAQAIQTQTSYRTML